MNKTLIIAAALATLMMAPTGVMAGKFEVQLAPSQQLERAKNALMEGKTDRAIKLYKTALKRGVADAEMPMLHNNLCIAYLNQQEADLALKHCDRAVSLRPNDWRYWNNRGNVYFQKGSFAEALSQYERAIAMSPKSEALIRNIRLAEEVIEQSPIILDGPATDPDIGNHPDGRRTVALNF